MNAPHMEEASLAVHTRAVVPIFYEPLFCVTWDSLASR